MRKISLFLVAILILSICLLLAQRHGGERTAVCYTDTITVYDTVRVVTTKARDSVVLRYARVALPISPPGDTTSVIDTNSPSDTAIVELPIEQKHYADTSYDVWISGYQPQLDSLRLYQPTTTVVRTEQLTRWRTRRWGLSVGAGASLTPRGIEPGIFVGVSYTLFAW